MDVDRTNGRKARLEDVARHAGVAMGTVSNALNRPHKVRPGTLARIQQAIDELDFVPDRRARALAGGTSKTIGFVTVDLSNTFFLDMARGAERAASEFGMNVLLGNADNEFTRQQAYLGLFEEEHMGGILVAPVPGSDVELLRLAERRQVVVLNHCPGDQVCCVTADNELGGYLAARHLIATGRRHLLFPSGPDVLEPLVYRRRGVERAVDEAKGVRLTVVPVDQVQVPDGRAVGSWLTGLRRADRPDGIVAPADLLALGIQQSILLETDWRIPDDISLIGYDNNRAAWDSPIPISTVGQPGEEMGRVATRLLHSEITDDGHRHEHVVLKPELIVRASTQVGSGQLGGPS